MTRLLVIRGDVIETEIELTRRDFRIGRSPDNDVVLSDPTHAVSRYHAELRYQGGGYVLIDLNSQNGTWVDGRSIRQVDLRPGESAMIGPYSLMLEAPRAAIVAPPRRSPEGTAAPVAGAGQDTGKARTAEPLVTGGHAARASRVRRHTNPVAPQGGGPIAWLARQPKPMVFGGFVLFMGLLLSVLQMLSPDSPTPGPNSVTTKSNEEVVANLLSEGRALLDKGDATAALGYFERALIIKPDDPQALELKMKAQEQRRKVPAAGGPGSQR